MKTGTKTMTSTVTRFNHRDDIRLTGYLRTSSRTESSVTPSASDVSEPAVPFTDLGNPTSDAPLPNAWPQHNFPRAVDHSPNERNTAGSMAFRRHVQESPFRCDSECRHRRCETRPLGVRLRPNLPHVETDELEQPVPFDQRSPLQLTPNVTKRNPHRAPPKFRNGHPLDLKTSAS